ncbi:hypothetical protein [Leptotrichia shahii]|uniref:hypothetical protein n=1 Tax=Leptotrichia shahii TaxID=157691 RepID=UPI0028D18FBE|nr:hypothetical protein [Leptotrichia shahii]
MNNNFIPARDKKEKKDIERKRKSEKNSKKESIIYEKELREKLFNGYAKNINFKKIFDEIEKNNEDKKKILNLAQFNRFYDFVKENNYDFFDGEDKLKKFIEKQLERKYAVKFYIFIWNEFCYQIPKGKLKNKVKIEEKKIGEYKVENLSIDTVKSIEANENLKNEIKEETKIKLKIIEGYLLYILGKKRIDEKLKN